MENGLHGFLVVILLFQNILFVLFRKWANKHDLDFETVSLLRSLHLDDTAALSKMNHSQLDVSSFSKSTYLNVLVK